MKKELFDEKFENMNLSISPKELGGNGFSQLIEDNEQILIKLNDKNI